MKSKLIAAGMALAAFVAFAVAPTVASASPVLTENGVAVSGKPLIRAHNVNGSTFLKTTSGTTLVECSTATMTGELTENTGSSIKGDITSAVFSGTGTSGDCTGSGSVKVTTTVEEGGKQVGLPWCISSNKATTFEVRGGLCTEAARPLKFTLDFTSGFQCAYERASVTGSYTTSNTDSVLSLTNAGPFKRYEQVGIGAVFCPEEGTLTMSFTLETDVEGTNSLGIS